MAGIFTYANSLYVGVRKRYEWTGARWEFVLQAGASDRIEHHLTREEAVRLHRSLGQLIRATAPPKGRK